MGAYDNPKSYTTVDYTTGTKAFNTTFQTQFAAGIAEGDKLIADRKKYEDTVYAQGKEMEAELSAAVDNGEKTKEQINTALEEFYAEALNVEQPTKKGLGGLFSMPTENRMDQKGMREAQNSFEGAVTPINTVLDYIYTSDMDINQDNDNGHALYKHKKNIYEALKNGKAKPTFKYDNKTKKFTSFIEVDGEIYDEARLQTIFTASGKEQRDIIDAEHDTLLTGLKTRTTADLKNHIAKSKEGGDQSAYADASEYALRNAYQQFGLSEDGKIDPTKHTKNELSVANNVYNNNMDLNEDLKKNMLEAEISGFNLNTGQKDLLLDLPLNVGPKEIEKKLGVDEPTSIDIFEKSKAAKLKMVAQYTVNKMESEGLFDEFYRNEPKQQEAYRATDADKKRYEVNKYSKNRTNKITQMLFNTGAVTEDQMVGSETDLMVNAEFTNQFMGKVVKINDGKLKTIKGMTINKAGDVEFEYEKGEMSGEVTNDDGTVSKTKFDLKANQSYNIYNPSSQKAMYKALGGDIKGEETGIQYDNLYEQNMASSLINNPSVFNNQKMSQWARFIGSDKSLLNNSNFSNWLLDEKNAEVVKAYPGFQRLKSISQLK